MKKSAWMYFLIMSCLFCPFLFQAQADAAKSKHGSTPHFPKTKYVDNNGVSIAYTSSGK